YKKQLDKLYRPTIEELNAVGDVLPMLAHDYTKVGHRLSYPCFVSPKLDGVRCLAHLTPDSITFTSRGGKPYNVPKHLYEELRTLQPKEGKLVLDGELYYHGMTLQNIVSAVKNKKNPVHKIMQFHIFDVPSEDRWEQRKVNLSIIRGRLAGSLHIKFVKNELVDCEEDARKWMDYYIQEGYEGMMLRAPAGYYIFNHRSSDLMKWKDFQDIEAKIVGCREDKNGEGVLLCNLPSGVAFECKMRGATAFRNYNVQSKLVGEWLTVRFQQFTDRGAPQFPVGIAIRWCDKDGNPIE
ncbi:MAG: hypothetical protein ACRDCE_02635, partial [Cetobacterium sp.]|uniref:ATP-dependent DNA ligase n=1 Tax=Cetobacterium sp. TaxID=2071632 RepID=UPI003EE56712